MMDSSLNVDAPSFMPTMGGGPVQNWSWMLDAQPAAVQHPRLIATPAQRVALSLRARAMSSPGIDAPEDLDEDSPPQQLLRQPQMQQPRRSSPLSDAQAPPPASPQQQPQPQPGPGQQSLYKTELCRSFAETGSCRYGSKCQFAHGKDELRQVSRHPRYKTEICKTFHTVGTCRYGTRCRFIHMKPEEYEQYQQQQAAAAAAAAQQQPSLQSPPPAAAVQPSPKPAGLPSPAPQQLRASLPVHSSPRTIGISAPMPIANVPELPSSPSSPSFMISGSPALQSPPITPQSQYMSSPGFMPSPVANPLAAFTPEIGQLAPPPMVPLEPRRISGPAGGVGLVQMFRAQQQQLQHGQGLLQQFQQQSGVLAIAPPPHLLREQQQQGATVGSCPDMGQRAPRQRLAVFRDFTTS